MAECVPLFNTGPIKLIAAVSALSKCSRPPILSEECSVQPVALISQKRANLPQIPHKRQDGMCLLIELTQNVTATLAGVLQFMMGIQKNDWVARSVN